MDNSRHPLVVAAAALVIRRAGAVQARRVAGLAALLIASATTLTAHDFWLVPDAFAVATGSRMTLRGQTSSLFPSSLSAVTPDRIVAAVVMTDKTTIPVRNVSVDGASLRISHSPAGASQHVIGVQLATRSVRESPASFRRYLDLEGAPEARLRFERAGLLPTVGGDSITRRYAKYAKTIVEVGNGPRAFHRIVGHPLEFVPLSDPSKLRSGDTLRVRLMLLGKAAPFARLHAGSVALTPGSRRDTIAARQAAARDVSLETDSTGVAAIVIRNAGLWNVRTLQIVPAATGSGADWDVHWATLVFRALRR
ncbi:MAG: DUF4198 domain-containing protein [Gemmatimonas sp.]